MPGALPARILREAVKLDRSGLAAGRALHNAVGVAVPLFIGVATDRLLEGVVVAGGAINVGFADIGSPYAVRTRIMVTASVAAAVSSLVGFVGGGGDGVAVALMALWGFGAGLSVGLGPTAATMGLLSALALLLAEDFPTDVPEALRRAALVLAGGLLQTVLAVLVWPITPTAPERGAVAAECRALAGVADRWPDSRPSMTFIRAANAAESILAVHRIWAASRSAVYEALRRVAAELERIYGELFALRLERERLAGAAAAAVDATVVNAAETLRAVARTLRHPLVVAPVDGAKPVSAGDQLDGPAAARLAALRARLDALVELCGSLHGHPTRPATVRATRVGNRSSPGRSGLEILRANLTFRSAAFRHGVRLGVTLGIAVAVYRVFPLGRGYWVPLTVIFVLKPDFGATFTRGLQRFAGTVLGVALATLVAAALAPGDWATTALIAACAWAAYTFFFANYAAFTASVTSLIVFFTSFQGLSTYTAVVERLEDTAVGGALALGAFVVWPTWERSDRVAANVADLLDADRSFLAAVLGGPGRADEVQRARSAARLARTNAEASLERALSEPARARGDVTVAAGVLLASRSFADALLASDARLLDEPGSIDARSLEPFVLELDRALGALAAAGRGAPAPDGFPALRRTLGELAGTVPEWLERETGEMVDSIETMRDQLSGSAS